MADIPTPMMTRLGGLAQKHDSVILCLTHKDGDIPSLGSLISVRGQARRSPARQHHVGTHAPAFDCEVHILKDKRRGPGWTHREVCRGPDGVR